MNKISTFTVSNKKWILLILFTSPAIWWLLSKSPGVLAEWSNYYAYLISKLENIYSEQRLVRAGLMRWSDVDQGFIRIFSKILYNRFTILIDELFDYLSFLSPRIYFQAGDGSAFSPPEVEPIPVILFPFYIIGITEVIREKWKIMIIYLSFAGMAYFAGNKTLSYLLPVLIMNIYFVSLGVGRLKNKVQRIFMIPYAVYSLYILARMLWLVLL